MTRRLALLLANDYYENTALSPLIAPRNDAEQLFNLLHDPEVGSFEPAEILVNRSKSDIERSVERMFKAAQPGDLLLLYYSGHGIRDAAGRLHLAVWNTEPDLLHSTSVSASFLKELIEESQASSVVILLDCCYSGAFSSGLKSQPQVDLERELKAGSGVYVITASTAVEIASDGYSRGGTQPDALSAFTDAIVRGLATGAADVNGLGRVTANDMWEYVRREVPKKSNRQTPMQYGYFEDEVHLARVRGPHLSLPGTSTTRVHVGDLLGSLSQTEDRGLRAEEWLGTGRLIVPIGQVIRGSAREEVVFLDLGRNDGHLIVVGKMGSGKSTLLRTLVGALVLTHSPDEVMFYCLDSGGNRLGSLRRLQPFVAGVAADDEANEVDSILAEVSEQIRHRKQVFRDNDVDSMSSFRALRSQLNGGPYPDIFLLIDRWYEFAESRPDFVKAVRNIANAGLDYGVHLVLTARRWQDIAQDLEEVVPAKIELQLTRPDESRFGRRIAEQLPPDSPGWAIHRGRRFRVALPALRTALGVPEEAYDDTSDGAAELINTVIRARIETGSATAPVRRLVTPLSADISLLQLLHVEDPYSFDVARAWAPRPPRNLLRVPVGVSRDGRPMELDLKESAQGGIGPHGLLIGATGSGKSELLRTLVLGLAATHSSETLNFVLVDFKGGATFATLDRLPHVAGVITNLADELRLVDRMTDAISGELVRRQELLRRGGNFANQRDYEKARAGGAALAPLPSLLVICDEFSELLTAKPEFIDMLVQIGRVGRSLGVHLLLASQRLEEGRLRGLDTHLSYRIGLRTFSAMESRSVLGVPDAYELPRSPGHGYLKFGTEQLVRFKTAYVSAAYRGSAGAAAVDRPGAGSEAVHLGLGGSDGGAAAQETVLDILAARLASHGEPAHKVWLPPLSTPPSLEELLGPCEPEPERGLSVRDPQLRGALQVPVALVDIPFEQRQDVLWLRLHGAAGHVAVVGGPQSGKSTLLRSFIMALALTHTPLEAQIYCLDFGGGQQLASVQDLPHVGGVAGRLDTSAVRRTVSELTSLLADRERDFAALGVDTIAAYRLLRSASGAAAPGTDASAGDVFLIIDGWATLRSEYDELEPVITDLAARGLSYGIHLVCAASRWMEFRPGLRDLFGSRLELRLGDPSESSVSRRAAMNVPERTPGRGITTDSLHFLAARPTLGSGDPLASGDPLDLVRAVSVAWAGPSARPVRLLPTVVPYSVIEADRDPANRLALPIGLNEADLHPVRVDFDAESHLLMFGDAECGKSSFLRALATTLASRFTPEQARIILVDYRRSLLGAIESPHLIGYGTTKAQTEELIESIATTMQRRLPGPDITPQQLRSRSWWTGPECFVLVDDYDLVAAGQSNPLLPLLEYLTQARDVGLHLVLARRSGGASRALYESVLMRLREMGSPGIVMSGDRDEGALLANIRPTPMPPGRGWLVTRKEGTRLIQIAYLPTDN
ncbi:MAG: type VII secretion protein EccCb [Actinobacteria bacterium 13_2_20CM_2_71_6]|nr:MAG: type VII secretion protein EccCb [Actinobacteria bacterium 13_2_20CM_2_71_6]